jgi:hypothetical protein
MQFSSVQIVVGTPEMLKSGRGETAVTSQQAAAMLGVTGGRLLQLVKAGALEPCAKLGTAFVFREADVLALSAERARR